MKKDNILNIFKSEFVKNASVLIGGNISGQAIALLVYPILSRIYSDADLGVFALFMSVINILTIIATGKYEEAIVLTNDQKETHSLVGFVFKILSLLSLFVFLVLLFAREEILAFLKMKVLLDYWYLIPLTVFFTGFSYILVNLAIKRKKFKNIATANLSSNSSSSFFKLLFGFLSFYKIGLMISTLFSQIIACLSYYRLRNDLKSALNSSWKDEKQAGINYKAFPMYSMSRNLVFAFSSNLPFLLLTGVFGESALGLFSMALTMGFRPTSLITSSMYQVFFEKTTVLKNNNEKILPGIKKFWTKTALYLLPVFIIAFFIAPEFFGFVFGAKWKLSGIYFSYLIPWVFLSILSHPMLFIPALFSKQRQALWLEIAYLCACAIVIYTGIHTGNFKLAIQLYSITGCIFALCSLIWYTTIIKQYEKNII